MKQFFCSLAIVCTTFATNAQTATVNITPSSATAGIKYVKIAANGGNIGLYGEKDGKAQFLIMDAMQWRDITSKMGNQLTRQISIGTDSLFQAFDGPTMRGYDKRRNDGNTYDPSAYKKSTITAYARFLADERSLYAGYWKDEKGRPYYVQTYDDDIKPLGLVDRGMSKEQIALFDKYPITRLAASSGKTFYAMLTPPQPGPVVLQCWTGKEWEPVASLAGTIDMFQTDRNGKLYATTETNAIRSLHYWDGKRWNQLSTDAAYGFKGTSVGAGFVAADGQLFVAGNEAENGEYIVNKWNNGSWTTFARLPLRAIDIAYTKGNIYAASGSGVYMAPEGGQITQLTMQQMAAPKDMKVEEVHELALDFMKDYALYVQPVIASMQLLARTPFLQVHDQAEKALNELRSFIMDMTVRYNRLRLVEHGNDFAEVVRANMQAATKFGDAVSDALQIVVKQGTTVNDRQRATDLLNKTNIDRKELLRGMESAYQKYVAKNGLVFSQEILAPFQASSRVDSAIALNRSLVNTEPADIAASNASIKALTDYTNGPMKQQEAHLRELAGDLRKSNYEKAKREIERLRDEILDKLRTLQKQYESSMNDAARAQLSRLITSINSDYQVPLKSVVKD